MSFSLAGASTGGRAKTGAAPDRNPGAVAKLAAGVAGKATGGSVAEGDDRRSSLGRYTSRRALVRRQLTREGPLPEVASIHPTGCVDNEATFTTFSLLSLSKGRAVRLSCSTVPLPGAHDALRNPHPAGGPSRA